MTPELFEKWGIVVIAILSSAGTAAAGVAWGWVKQRQAAKKQAETNEREEAAERQRLENERIQREQEQREKEQKAREEQFDYFVRHYRAVITQDQKRAEAVQDELRAEIKSQAAKIDGLIDDHRACRESLAEARMASQQLGERCSALERELANFKAGGRTDSP